MLGSTSSEPAPIGSSYAPLAGSPPPASDLAPPEADQFYRDSLRLLAGSGIPFLVAGTFAVNCYTGINRATKDLDIFCKAGDFPRILLHFKEQGFETEIEDERWLAKVRRGRLLLRRDLRLGHRRRHRLRPLVPGEPPGRALRRAGPAHAADRDDLVQGAAAEPAPLRRRRHRPPDPAPDRADRLAAAAHAHGAVLGSAADPRAQLPLHLSLRARAGAALAVRRAAPARAPSRPTCRCRRPRSAAAACSRPRTTASTSRNGASPTWWARRPRRRRDG